MAKIESLLDFLCGNRFERAVVSEILAAGDGRDRKFCLDVHTRLADSCRGISFDCYHAIARCHVLFVATAPDCSDMWASIVLEELTRRLVFGAEAAFNAFVMGSQLGLFQAGKWLQEKQQVLLGEYFLPEVARYCIALFGKECLPVNICNYESEIRGAQQDLDRAVKDYLRPQNSDLTRQIRPQIREMLIEVQQIGFIVESLGIGRGCGADRWLLDALLHGSLDITNCNRYELIQAALAIGI